MITKMSPYRPMPDSKDRFNLGIRKALLIGLGLLAPFTALKVKQIQSVEVYGLVALWITAAAVFRNDLRLRGNPDVLSLLQKYAIFLSVAAIFAFWALRLPTFPPPGTPLIKHAPLLSLARLTQLAIVISGLLFTAQFIISRPSLCALICQCYVYGGLISAVYGIVSSIGAHAGLHLSGAYGSTHRIRGFFVEGGPFGVYLISVMLVNLFRRKVLQRGDPRFFWIQMALLLAALAGSASKAGILLALCLAVFYIIITHRARYLFFFLPLFIGLALSVHLIAQLQGYADSYLHFSTLARKHPNDLDLIEGRVMGAIQIPIMVAHHPITGIGIGNYPLERNNPVYLGTLPRAPDWDLPGLGLLGDVAEFGIPLLLYIIWLLWRPVVIAKRAQAPPFVVALGAYQILAHLLGVQLTFVYPWIVSGIVIGYSVALEKKRQAIAAESS
jgi:hypothetical protein